MKLVRKKKIRQYPDDVSIGFAKAGEVKKWRSKRMER